MFTTVYREEAEYLELGELLPKLPGPAGYPSSPPCPSSQDLPVPAALPSLKYLPAPEELPPAAPDLPARTPDVEEAIPCTSPLMLPEHSPSARSPLQSGPYSCQDLYYRVDRYSCHPLISLCVRIEKNNRVLSWPPSEMIRV